MMQFMMPFHTITPSYAENRRRNWRAWVPIDDAHVFVIELNYHPTKPFTQEQREMLEQRPGVWTISPPNRATRTSAPFGRWYSTLPVENDFLQDRELQKTGLYSGIREFFAQDAAPQYTKGPTYNRTSEHLCTSDTGIISAANASLNLPRRIRLMRRPFRRSDTRRFTAYAPTRPFPTPATRGTRTQSNGARFMPTGIPSRPSNTC